ncbi:hypothetical protein CDL12_17809 [Handroanthus impetiginosus]|uniref:Uncharacterized protein n=1 Tax=Handroanthus impetiginosus TaxID=429701 RepID=A0A2G9GWF0_9LAMI|nr:hypothetical protein CDL12_17809 [Handroanthus impetiginosus]
MADDHHLFQQLQEEDDICNSTAAHHHPSAAIQPRTTTDSLDNGNKRHCSSSFQEPSSKRATHRPPSSPSSTGAASDYHLLGFTKLPLPHSFPTSTPSPLRRTVSEPIYSEFSEFPNSQQTALQEISNGNVVHDQSSPLPNIYRTMSDPNSLVNRKMAAVGSTPPRPPARNSSSSPSVGESPTSKRLRRMKERMKVMRQWWNQVVCESDEEEDGESDKCIPDHNTPKEECENHEMENPSQESVWVEKNGDCLVLHFKCPCGHGYQILLSRNNCYYKLTTF